MTGVGATTREHAPVRVDAVVLWVDGDDPAHLAKREAWRHQAAPENGVNRKAVMPTRFTATFELEYNLRLLRRNAPWLGTIFVVTDDQCPEWLTSVCRDELGVRLVDHREVFRGYENALPVFNSRSIETLLFNIPGLAEHFIYLNDDFFLIRPARVEDWFVKGQVLVRGRPYTFGKASGLWRKWGDRLGHRFGGARYCGGAVGLVREKAMLRPRARQIVQLSHTPLGLVKSALRDVLTEAGLDTGNSHYRFRSSQQVRPLALVLNEMVLRGQARLAAQRDWYYINGERHGGRALRQRLRYCRDNEALRMLCVNSIDRMRRDDQVHVRHLLDFFLE